MKRAVITLSGGLDSATVLAMAKAEGYECYVISFDYGQRSYMELAAAKKVCDTLGVAEHKIFKLDIGQFGGSALTDTDIDIPTEATEGIPVTYVPARNTIFLSIALGWAEVLGAFDIFIGVNAVDFSGYPDCRPEFIDAFTQLANKGTKAGVEQNAFRIHAPLMNMSKAQIILVGVKLGLDYGLTCSCYDADEQGRACGRCDSCVLRAEGFLTAGTEDPTIYF